MIHRENFLELDNRSKAFSQIMIDTKLFLLHDS